MTELTQKECKPCRGETEPMRPERVRELHKQVSDWTVLENRKLRRSWSFDDFQAAWTFADKVAELAEAENHHPTISFTWGRTSIELWTHKIDGLSENDFILAAKIDRLGE